MTVSSLFCLKLSKSWSILFKSSHKRYHIGNCFYYTTFRGKQFFKISLYFSWQNIRRKCYVFPISLFDTENGTRYVMFSKYLAPTGLPSKPRVFRSYVNRLYTPQKAACCMSLERSSPYEKWPYYTLNKGPLKYVIGIIHFELSYKT